MSKKWKINGRCPKFIINKEAGVVVALLENCAFDCIDAIDKEEFSDISICEFMMNPVYRGVARLACGDVFNEDKGKEIAFNILKKKYYSAMQRILSRHIRKQSDIADRILQKI